MFENIMSLAFLQGPCFPWVVIWAEALQQYKVNPYQNYFCQCNYWRKESTIVLFGLLDHYKVHYVYWTELDNLLNISPIGL